MQLSNAAVSPAGDFVPVFITQSRKGAKEEGAKRSQFFRKTE
jgi:hypothetical protein